MKLSFFLFNLLMAFSLFSAPVRYVLQDGETLYSLSQKFQIPVDLIMSINGIGNERALPIGMEITIPGVHQVLPGETIYSLSLKYGVDQDELMSVNRIRDPQDLRVGIYLLIPADESSSNQSTTTNEELYEVETVEWSEDVDNTQADDGSTGDTNRYVSQDRSQNHPRQEVTEGWLESLVEISAGYLLSRDGFSYNIALASGNIRSILPGKVVYIGRHRNLGLLLLLEISDNQLMGITGMDQYLVSQGDSVATGDLLGQLGMRGELRVFAYRGGQPWNVEDAFNYWKILP